MGLSGGHRCEINTNQGSGTTAIHTRRKLDASKLKKYKPIGTVGKVLIGLALAVGVIAIGILTGGVGLAFLGAIGAGAIYAGSHFGINSAVNKASEVGATGLLY